MNVKHKQGVFLGAVAVLLVGIAVAGLEEKVFPNRVDMNALNKPYVSAAEGGVSREALQKKLASSWAKAYVIAKRVSVELKALVAAPAGQDRGDGDFVNVRVTGIMRGADGAYNAIINRSLVHAGGMVNGCKVVRIEPDFVELDVYGTVETLRLNEEQRIRRRAFQELELQGVVRDGGIWKAKFNGYLYRAGDEIDSQTQVRAVTPSEVLVMRAGTMRTFKTE